MSIGLDRTGIAARPSGEPAVDDRTRALEAQPAVDAPDRSNATDQAAVLEPATDT
jgi:hypothetical protein